MSIVVTKINKVETDSGAQALTSFGDTITIGPDGSASFLNGVVQIADYGNGDSILVGNYYDHHIALEPWGNGLEVGSSGGIFSVSAADGSFTASNGAMGVQGDGSTYFTNGVELKNGNGDTVFSVVPFYVAPSIPIIQGAGDSLPLWFSSLSQIGMLGGSWDINSDGSASFVNGGIVLQPTSGGSGAFFQLGGGGEPHVIFDPYNSYIEFGDFSGYPSISFNNADGSASLVNGQVQINSDGASFSYATDNKSAVLITQENPWGFDGHYNNAALEVVGYTLLNGVRINGADAANSVYLFGGQFGFSCDPDQPMTFSQVGSERMRIDAYSGFVGIWNSSPAHLLDLSSAWIDSDGSASFAGGNFQVYSDGSITINPTGSGAIDLNSDGSASFANLGIIIGADGSASFGNGSAHIDYDGSIAVYRIYVDPGDTADCHWDQNGISLQKFSGTPQIQLNSVDGSASFAGGAMNISANGEIKLPSLADSAASNSSLYFSTTSSKPVWKDSGGSVHALY